MSAAAVSCPASPA